MASINISSDDQELGRTIAAATADALGYECVDQSLLADVAARYDVPESELRRVLDPVASPRISSKSRRLRLAFIESVTLERLLKEDVVCVGLGAHLYVRGVSHMLMVRVLSDPQTLIERTAEEQKVSLRKAHGIVERNKKRRARWSLSNYGIAEDDASLYDMVISVSQIEQEKVVDVIKDMAGYRKFEPMSYSRKCLNDLALASQISVVLLPDYPDIRVRADGARAIVHVRCSNRKKAETAALIKKKAGRIPGVDLVAVHASSTMRKLASRRRTAASS